MPENNEKSGAVESITEKQNVSSPLAFVEYSEEAEPWSKHAAWKIPCFFTLGEKKQKPVFIEVRTNTVRRELWVDKTMLNFRQVAVGQRIVRTIRLKNLGEVSSPVRHSALNAVGPYQIVNAPRDLPANGGSATILIQFTPASNLVYDEILTFTTTTGRVDVRLIGSGVNPRLDIDPGNGVLDMGNCVSGEVLKSSFTLSNPGIFPITYAIQPLNDVPPNFNGMPVVSFSPSEATVAPGDSLVVEALYQSDNVISRYHCAEFKVSVPSEGEDHKLTVLGRCWASSVFLVPERSKLLLSRGAAVGVEEQNAAQQEHEKAIALHDAFSPNGSDCIPEN